MKMIGKTGLRCPYGCCGIWTNNKTEQRRWLKRSERQRWKQHKTRRFING